MTGTNEPDKLGIKGTIHPEHNDTATIKAPGLRLSSHRTFLTRHRTKTLFFITWFPGIERRRKVKKRILTA